MSFRHFAESLPPLSTPGEFAIGTTFLTDTRAPNRSKQRSEVCISLRAKQGSTRCGYCRGNRKPDAGGLNRSGSDERENQKDDDCCKCRHQYHQQHHVVRADCSGSLTILRFSMMRWVCAYMRRSSGSGPGGNMATVILRKPTSSRYTSLSGGARAPPFLTLPFARTFP